MEYRRGWSIKKMQAYKDSPHFKEVINLVSFPRSGNTFTRYILETLTGYRSIGYVEGDRSGPRGDAFPIRDHFPGGFNEDGLIRKYHHYHEIIKSDGVPQGKTILLIRNPVESKLRQQYTGGAFRGGAHFPEYYFENIRDFFTDMKKFDSENFIILTYEELVKDPKCFVDKLCGFLGLPISLSDKFISNLAEHRKMSLGKYSTQLNQTPITEGRKTHVEKEKMSARKYNEYYSAALITAKAVSDDVHSLLIDLYGNS